MPGLLRLVPLALVALSLWLWPNDASAQTVTINQTAITREEPLRGDETSLWISRRDCTEDDVFTIPIATTSSNGLTVQVWVSDQFDCSNPEFRDGVGTDCARVFQEAARPPEQRLTVRAQDIVQAVLDTQGDPCNVQSGGSLAQQFTLYVMLTNGNVIQGQAATFRSQVDLEGPSAPTGVKAGAGERMLVVNWSASDAVDIVGYRLYCDPAPGGVMDAGAGARLMAAPVGGAGGLPGTGGVDGTFGGAAGAGTGGSPPVGTGGGDTAGAGGTIVDPGGAGAAGIGPVPGGVSGSGGTATSQSCPPSSVLTPGQVPSTAVDENHLCGTITGQLPGGEATGLENGVLYRVSVAGVDRLGNIGRLSSLGCAVPKEVTDFFEAYREAGGEGGGGFCSAGGAAQPALSLLFGGGLLTYIWRRRRRAA